MKQLQVKEQIMLAYYAQYFKGATYEDIRELDRELEKIVGEEDYKDKMAELKMKGLICGMDTLEEDQKEGRDTPMATSKGMVYVNNVLNLQSETVEDHQLEYLKRGLETSHLEFTLEPIKEYIEEAVKAAAEKKAE